MKSKPISPWIIYTVSTLLFSLLIYLLDYKIIHIYAQTPFLGGSDGVGHWSIGQYYSEHIFPKTWGWVPIWSGGMPFPQFYPLFFYFFNALLAHMLPFLSYLTVTKIIVLGSIFLVPTATMWFAMQIFSIKNKPAEEYKPDQFELHTYFPAFLAGLLSVNMLCAIGGQSSLGFTLQSALNKGFVPQFFSLIPILLCLGSVVHVQHRTKAKYFAGFFYCVALLSNVHTALLLVVVLTCVALVEMILSKSIKSAIHIFMLYFKIFGISSLCCLFWILPLLDTYSYFSSALIGFSWDRIDTNFEILCCVSFPIAFYIAWVRKNSIILGSSIAITLISILAIYHIDTYFPTLPFHMYRWLAITPYLCVIFLAYIVDSLVFEQKKARYILALLILIGTGSLYYKSLTDWTDQGVYLRFSSDNTETLLDTIEQDPGVTLVGTDADSARSANFVIDSLLGLRGIPTITHIIRESAPSGMFLTPIRNMFSTTFEMAGVRTYIGKNEKFTRMPIEDRIDIAKNVGVRYLIVSDKDVLSNLSTSTMVQFKGSFGPHDLYEIKDFQPLITVPQWYPHLVFTPLDFKVRDADEYNFTTFNEQLLLNKFFPNILLARDPSRTIDQIPESELRIFSSLTFTEYNFKDLRRALELVAEFSKTKPVYVIEYKLSNPLYEGIITLAQTHSNIHIYGNSPTKKNKSQSTNKNLKKIFADMLKTQTATRIHPEGMLTSTQNQAEQNIPYYIRQTYYPWWKQKNGIPLYTISPFYTLMFNSDGKQKTIQDELYFDTGTSVYIGYAITVTTLIAIIAKRIRYKKK